MADKMLIDASHEEETRVVVVRGNRIEEFDFESQHKKQLRGNIYLAKVTRVEPSLQAAFVEYGGNRHGFLAFSEIHPDYYQIPLADRQALLQAEAEAERADAESDNGDGGIEHESTQNAEEAKPAKPKSRRSRSRKKTPEPVAEASADSQSDGEQPEGKASFGVADETNAGNEDDESGSTPDEMLAAVETDSISEDVRVKRHDDEDDEDSDDDHNGNGHKVDSVGAEDAMEEVPDRSRNKPRRQYRIQEVIKRRQILLVQVVKEERGNKGAALTTYLSLAGRYSVLMPNTARGGGISRKITNVPDRKRLKEIARELEVPQGMGVILRTAGANRTKAEIKRDFEYLMRLWENVRSLTLSSTAPTLVYEEGSLIKRSIRDLYNKDISEIVVAGEEGYREAKTFMKMLMPSHAKVVQPYRDIHPIFARSGIEAQLDRMLQPQVTLKSGGYIIINQTEALVAIDVNSGRSTKEHSIEDTALQTNLEAAEEVARQLRLRDLAGLIVIDFIDMEEKRNNRSVEKKVKDCLKHDRARIQVGRISHFGLLEMSRQRIRASVLESTTQVCEACGGTGHVRSKSSVALHVIRGVEEYLLKNTTHNVIVHALPETALYLLNQKRDTIVDLEKRFGLSITIDSDTHVGAQHFSIERGDPVEQPVNIEQIIHYDTTLDDDDDAVEPEADTVDEIDDIETERQAEAANAPKRKRRRRRRGGRSEEDGDEEEKVASHDAPDAPDATDDQDSEERQRKRRRRGKRGGRRKRNEDGVDTQSAEAQDREPTGDTGPAASPETQPQALADETPTRTDETEAEAEAKAVEAPETAKVAEDVASEPVEAPKRKRARRTKAKEEQPAEKTEPVSEPAVADAAGPKTAAEEKQPRSRENAESSPARRTQGEQIASEPVLTSSDSDGKDKEESKPKKAGWWQRRGFF